MKKPEVTSKKVASIVGRILKIVDKKAITGKVWCWQFDGKNTHKMVTLGTIEDLKALAASALTQAEDKETVVWLGYANGPLKAKDLAENLLTDRARRILDSLPREIKAKPKRKKPARKGKR